MVNPSREITNEVEIKEENFKNKKFYFSYSSLVKLLNDPPLFYKEYILKEREDKSAKHFDIGDLMHCLVLEPEEFENKFYTLTCKKPGGKLLSVIESVFRVQMLPRLEQDPTDRESLDFFERAILLQLEAEDLYQGLVDAKRATNGVKLTANQKRLEKAITEETKKYFLALQEATGKTVIDMDTAMVAREKANAILTNPKVIPLLTESSIKHDVRTELELKAEFENYPYHFGLKGIVDCVKIDYEEKKIYITDLKSTSKSLQAWKESFRDSPYMYWLQSIVYKELILDLVPKESKTEWQMVLTFVVIDKENKVYPFKVSKESLQRFEMSTVEAFKRAEWHLKQNSYALPYEYEMGLVEL
jgi:hypothetical protein